MRDTAVEHFVGYDAVIHLASLSNDPLGDLNAEITYDINHLGTMHVARSAKAAGVPRFLFSSSCSLYGAHGNDYIDETAEFHPVTPYGISKLRCEVDLSSMADDDFSPTYLRNATAYGVSPRLRGDLVVNNLTGHAVATGAVYMKSDGTPWRPLVHIEDIARAFLAIAEAPRDLVHGEAFNVGSTAENYQIRDVARIVEEVVVGAQVALADSAGPDLRNYRVSCDKLYETLPDYEAVWTVRAGVEQLHQAFIDHGLTIDELEGPRFRRLKHISGLVERGVLDESLRWTRVDEAV
ncbi:MAG: SDR family oxidoreductase [Acidimicrobiia bacterium]|nr:SDR family oxidoreductase [Acidimicrobiia bacterium]